MKRAVLGIDLGGTNIKAGIFDENGTALHRASIPTRAEEGHAALLGRLRSLIDMYRIWCKEESRLPAAVGIGTAGFVDTAGGRVAYATSNLPGWTGLPLRDELETAAELPVSVANDAHAMALGEAWLGAGRTYRDFVCVTLGTGVGGARVVDGAPDYGGAGFAGAFGHMTIAVDGAPCNCGSAGCWEQYASVTALMRLARESGLPAAERADGAALLFAEARSGDPAALSVIDRYSSYIAAGIVNLLHAMNPEAVIVGGAVTAQGDFLLGRVRRFVYGRAMPIYRETPIAAAQLGNDAGVAGAALLAWERWRAHS